MVTLPSGVFWAILAAFLRPVLQRTASHTRPLYEGRVLVPGLQRNVNVYRDDYGIPHVLAGNEDDLFLAQGYLHAQERLWQMDINRRFLSGRLAEIFGGFSIPWRELSTLFREKESFELDYFIRLIGLHRTALASLEALNENDHRRLNAYSAGVNRYIERCGKKLPWEFKLLRYEADPWKPEDSILITKGFAFFLSTALFTRLSTIALAAKLDGDQARLKSLYPGYPEDGPTVTRAVGNSANGIWRFINGTFLRSDWHPAGHGSNNWVIAPDRSQTGKAVLCNDPHLRMTLPSLWYLMHLRAEPNKNQPDGYEVWGASIPGSPCIHVGHNRWIAWGVTAAVCDDVELYRERIHRLDPNFYLADHRWLAMMNRWETIHVRGKGDIQRNIRLTRHGPVISDFQRSTESAEVISFCWTAHEPSKELHCVYGVNCARNWNDFLSSLSHQVAPSLSYVYADQEGNIGYTLAGKIPVRSQVPSLLPVEGWHSKNEWQGYIPFSNLPRLYNPPEGVIATANNQVVDSSYPYYLSLFFEPPFRIRRIKQLLMTKKIQSIDDMARIQMDTVSLQAVDLIDRLRIDLRQLPPDDPKVEEAANRLLQWDGDCRESSVAAAIYHVFHRRLMENLLVPVLGEELFLAYIEIFNQCLTPIDGILCNPDSPWFAGRPRNLLVAQSLREACDDLKQTLGDHLQEWQWGKIHLLQLNHALGRIKILQPLLTVGPFPSPGDGVTINMGFYRRSNPFNHTVGASLRMIVNVGSWERPGFILPTGQSGHFMSPHFADQTALWRKGQYIPIYLDENARQSKRHLSLEAPSS